MRARGASATAVGAMAIAAAIAAAAAARPPWQRVQPLSGRSGDAAVVAAQWARAGNRAWCAPLAFASVRVAGTPAGPRVRPAVFVGGWAVAYDLPGDRSAFGLAGAGVRVRGDDVSRWPTVLRWSDGSAAGLGLEGDVGPGALAYVRVAGQGCLYNVWSHLGVAHLRRLIAQLRAVRPLSP